MTCSGGVCSPTASSAVLNVQDLAAMLASGSATVTTTGAGVQAVDIRIDARLSWSAGTTLSLAAFRSIALNRKVTVAGAGGVSLNFHDGGRGGEFACGDKGALTFANTSGMLTIDGTAYTLVDSVASLATAIAANPAGDYALAKNYDAKKDGVYASAPIPTVFSGSFNGLGNAVSNLSINDPTEDSYVGLFAETDLGSTISNVRLPGENVEGGSGSSIQSSTEFIGGLVGYTNGGSVANSFTSGIVGGGTYAAVGGLIGIAEGPVNESGSAATVSNVSSGDAGGLLGGATGTINSSYSTGGTSGAGYVGGLVGFYAGNLIKRSWASGTVSSSDVSTSVGGLAGINQFALIDQSHASGALTCQFVCGGLVGWLGAGVDGTPRISQSFATGSVTGTGMALGGGLIGFNESGAILNSYASGAISTSVAGGLAGQNENPSGYHSISGSYASGTVTSSAGYAGGVVGYDDFYDTNTIKHVYWDMTTSGITDPGQGAGNVANDTGIKGLSDAQLKSDLPKGFNPKIWKEDSSVNGGLPYLIANPPQN